VDHETGFFLLRAALFSVTDLSAKAQRRIVKSHPTCANFQCIKEHLFREFTWRSKDVDAFQKKNNAGNSYCFDASNLTGVVDASYTTTQAECRNI